MRKILIMGLPGAGKTTLAKLVAARLNGVLFNADDVRANISKDLGFSLDDRIEHARRMGWLCDRVVETGGYAVADFICPTAATRAAFFAERAGIVVFVDRIEAGRFADTNDMFEPPESPSVRVWANGTAEKWAEFVAHHVRPIFNPQKPTALLVGRFQPFHRGHKALAEEAIHREGQVCIGVRGVAISAANPFSFEYVRARIEHAMREHEGRYTVVPLPDITAIFYGRDVGYRVERVTLPDAVEAVSGTETRAREGYGMRARDEAEA